MRRDIERNQWPGSSDIDGHNQCEHMLNLVMVIAIFLGQKETIFDSNCLWHRQYVVENHKIQTNEFSGRPRKCAFCSRTFHMANDATESNS